MTDIVAISTIVNGAATAVYAVIAFLTLRHLSTDRRESRRPYLVVYGEDSQVISAKFNETDGIVFRAAEQSDSELYAKDTTLSVYITNAGNGAALNVELDWSIDGIDLDWTLRDLDRVLNIKSERNDAGWLKIGTSLISLGNDVEELSFIPGDHSSASTRRTTLPWPIELRLVLLLLTLDIDKYIERLRKTYINVRCRYRDLAGMRYENHFRFRVVPHYGSQGRLGKRVTIEIALDASR